jgi:hypothetical protein
VSWLTTSAAYQDSLLAGRASSGVAQDAAILALQLSTSGLSASGSSLASAVATLDSIVISATAGRFEFNVKPTTSGTSEIYDLANYATKSTTDSLSGRVAQP